VFGIVNKFHGLRVSAEDEVVGLDYSEHGVALSYSDFSSADASDLTSGNVPAAPPVSPAAAIPVKNVSTGKKLTKVTIITKRSKFEELKIALDQIGITGVTVTNVMGFGLQRGVQKYRGVPLESQLLPKVQVDVVISKVPVDVLLDAVKRALYTGNIGDGKIFVYDVENVVKVRTGEQGYDALQDTV
jgi:Amt family ammonium transporter